MGKPTGFLEYTRELPKEAPAAERVKNYKEFYLDFPEEKVNQQSARCMDCGIPFCHNGCPLGNIIPEFNDRVYAEDWEGAYKILASTNNFPEFTGRICPAPCENSCVLGINQPPVAIELIEKNIIEKAFELGIVVPNPPKHRTGKRVAVVGSGPAGMAAAAQLNQAGHWVIVFERDAKPGGLLRYGIPDFKLEKTIIDRRVEVMKEEGISFKCNANVGVDVDVNYLLEEFDAVVLSGGSTIPRDLKVTGREFKGVHFAMEFLGQSNRRVSAEPYSNQDILATDKHVVVIGGGDTGSDCVGTSNRHGAKSITQFELLPQPPEDRDNSNPWPEYARILRTSSSHREGVERLWCINTKEFIGDENGNLKALKIVDVEWIYETGKRPTFKEVEGSEREIPCDLAFLAIGFVGPQVSGMIEELGVDLDERGNVATNGYQTSIEKVFAAGDMRRGQSLVVWAISEGRETARAVDEYLIGSDSVLHAKNDSLLNTSIMA